MSASSRRVSVRLRRAVWRVGLWLTILFCCLIAQTALLEGVLRAIGYGESVRFAVRREVGGETVYTPNRAFYQQFTALPLNRIMTWDDLDFQVPAVKAPNAYRIFVFGGSAIYGTRSSARILEMMLRSHAPSAQWEVYNAACPGMNSHVMFQAARASADLAPDLFLIYMGNNEAVGPFGPATTLGQSRLLWRLPLVRSLIAANELRVTQLLRRSGAVAALNLPDADALMRMLPGMTDHPKTLAFYEENVADMCAAAERAEAQVLLCSLTGNRRYMGVVTPEPENDAGSINGVLRAQAARHDHAILGDVAGVIAAHSEDGLPGYDYFVDNVHFNFDGNYLAATAMFDALAPLLAERFDAFAAPTMAPPTRGQCAEMLAWTDAAEYELLGWQLQAFLDDHSRERVRRRHAVLQESVGEEWREQLLTDYLRALAIHPDDLYLRQSAFRMTFDMGTIDTASEQSRELLARHPTARSSLRSAGLIAEARSDVEAAIRAYRACLDAYPDDPEALRRLAELLFAQGNIDAAEPLYRRYLHSDGTDAFVWCRMAEIQARRGRTRRAANTLETVIAQAPTHPLAYRLLDDLMADTDTTEARAVFWDSMITEYPEAAEPLVRRALLHQEAGEEEEALALLRRAVALAPGDPVVQHHLGIAAYTRGHNDEAAAAFSEALRLNPADERNARWLGRVVL